MLKNLKEKLLTLIHDKEFEFYYKIFVIIMLVYIILIALKWNSLSPEIPIFYSLPRGNDQLRNFSRILILPLSSLFFFLLNFIIASLLYTKEKLASHLLIISSIIISMLLLITFIKIVLLIS